MALAFLQAERLEQRLVMSGVNVSTYHNDASSDGVNSAETSLSPNTVKLGSFGKLYQTPVDGAVYTQPLVQTGVTIAAGANTTAGAAGLHDIVLVGTENDSLYAMDTVSGAILWKRSFLDTTNPTGDTNNTLNASAIVAVPYADTSSGDINPTIGITGTPVIDPTSQVAYLVTVTKETIGGAAHYVQRLHAINLADGTDKVNPFLIGDTTNGNTNNTPVYDYGTGDGAVTDPYNGTGKPVVQFNALRENQRCSLDLENGSVYVEWASHGDNGPYHGWVTKFAVSNLTSAGIKLAGVLDTSPNGYEAGIWQGGGKLSFDSSGAFYLVTGNGANGVPVTLNAQGLVSNADYYEAVIKVVNDPTSTPTANNPNGWGLKVADFFIPSNSRNLDGADQDFGSGAPLVLPDSAGIPGHPHLLVAAGKQGVVYVIDRDNMGKFNATTDAVVSESAANFVGGALGTPAYFNNEIYYLGDYSSNLRAFTLNSNGTLSIASQTNPANNFSGLPGSVSISSSGTTNGIVWNLDRSGTNSLHAFDASDLSKELWNSNQAANGADSFGYSIKFGTPTIANGEVFLGTNTNALVGFGLKPPPNSPPAAPSNLAATAPSSTSVKLTWTDNSSNPNVATSFTIQDSTDGTHFTTVTTAPGGSTAITIGGLLSNTNYYFQIDASNGISASGYTKPVQINTGVTTSQAPAPPSGLNGTPVTATSVALNWINNATNQTGFLLDRATDSGFTQNLVTQTLPASPFTFTDSAAGLAPGGTYYYRIRAFNAVGTSTNANPIPVLIPDAPAKATNAAVTGVTSTEIDLSWTDNAGRTATGYNILRSTNNGTFALDATLPADNNPAPSTYTWADTGVTPGTSYEYHIEAVNSSGNNDFAGANAETITLAPSGLTPTPGNGQVTLTWTAPVGALSYNLYRGLAPGQETLDQTGLTATTYTDAATNGTKYYYTVTAVNNNINHAPVLPAESAPSSEVSATPGTTPPATPVINFPNGFTTGTAGVLTLNHGVTVVGGNLQLTDGGTYEARSAYSTSTVPISQFTSTFTFQDSTNTNAADGFTFVVQGVSNTVYGGIGSSLGYASSVNKSLAVKFDLFNNNGEGIDSTGVYTNGAAPTNVGSIDMTSSGVNLHSGDPLTATISYDGSNLIESVTDTVTHATFNHTYPGLNIAALVGGTQAYVGFTAGTGGTSATQNILSWTYSPVTNLPTAAPAAPSNLAATALSSSSVSLTWADNSTSPNQATSFTLQDSTDGVNFTPVATVPGGTTSYTVGGLTSATTYIFRISATDSVGTSGYATAPPVTTPAASGSAPAINFPNGFAAGTAGVLTFNKGAAVVGSSLQLSDGGTFENRSVFTTAPVAITAFRTTFAFQVLAGANTGDGFTFIIQGVGNTATGGIGGALGYQGIAKSLAVKFDLYSNSGEGANSTGVYTNGAAPTNVGSIDLTGSGINLHGGDPMTATITYDGANLVESITDTTTKATFTHTYTGLSIATLVGANQAYVGFGAGTGGSTATQNILGWTYTPTGTPAAHGNALPTAPVAAGSGTTPLALPTPETDVTPLAAGPDTGDGSAIKMVSLGSRNQGNGTRVRLTATGVPSGSQGFSFALNRIKAARMITPPPQASMNFQAIDPT